MSLMLTFQINDYELKTLSKNLQILMMERCVTENEIAQKIGLPVMTVRRLVSGETTDPRISTLKLIADFFTLTVDSLIQEHHYKNTLNIRKSTPEFIPILDWDTASKINSIKDLPLVNWKDWYPVVMEGQTLGKEAFAIESRPSMQPRFPLGTLFVVDPHENPIDGDLILIKMRTQCCLSLRELIIDSPRWQLQPVIAGSDNLYFDSKQHEIAGVVLLTILNTRKN